MSQEADLKEIAARLLGRIEITHHKLSQQHWEHFIVTLPSGNAQTFVAGQNQGRNRARTWASALEYARRHEGVIFGPPGYDTEL